MDDDGAGAAYMTPTTSPTTSPRSSPSKRMRGSHRFSRRESADDNGVRHRLKSEIHLTRELFDHDLVKGSAYFHTKPANHDRRIVKQGMRRALLLPFHAPYWRQKAIGAHAWFYEISTALYVLHGLAMLVYFAGPAQLSELNTLEVSLPIGLLLVVAGGYGRVIGTLQAGGAGDASDSPGVKLHSPTKSHSMTSLASPPSSPVRAAGEANGAAESAGSMDAATGGSATALASDLAESEGSDSTNSEDESGNSSSSSDETMPEEHPSASAVAPSEPGSMPPTPNGLPVTPRSHRASDAVDHVARRRVTVCVWEHGIARKKAMSVAELRNTILAKVKATPPREIYRKIAMASATTLSLVPVSMRLIIKCQELNCLSALDDPDDAVERAFLWWQQWLSMDRSVASLVAAVPFASTLISLSCMLCTYHLASIVFSALADAEVTYHRRLMYAKCFTALTSSRRSRANNLPHFRLKNVVNIKAWISLRGGRTWLKRQGRQRAADEIVSTSFLINMVLLAIMGIQAVSETGGVGHVQNLLRFEVTMWCLLGSIFMLRFMMLGSNINRKYQNTSLLLTEQMNLYLRLLVKPHKKEKLLVSNNVLKLASKLLKELNSPNKVSGLTMNPLLYNVTRVVVLSAFSSTASEFFGFKLKLWKMKHI
ncbi:hypothetical protein P43SY_009041 [Pythium insidiosum]|uniref:PHTF1/2 N-terminal domain-containing protein n=1 Tax=Pythium insidiosum TaxID=114742 RepID=A0AAD5M7S7_PYTIN|nr:hypothetical protein P43SY_009041 [Pythium insidiosum]